MRFSAGLDFSGLKLPTTAYKANDNMKLQHDPLHCCHPKSIKRRWRLDADRVQSVAPLRFAAQRSSGSSHYEIPEVVAELLKGASA